MDEVARLSEQDRADLFAVAAEQRGLSRAVIEKDFWVCWMLGRVFALTRPPAEILFKGGTSLSKAYGAIDRFSEDIDLVLDREGLGFAGERDPATAPSRKKRQRLIKDLMAASRNAVVRDILPALEDAVAAALGTAPSPDTWQFLLADDDAADQTILFIYPAAGSSRADAPAYIRAEVRLEFGARGDHWPTEKKSIRPYAAEEVPSSFVAPTVEVQVLTAERTFWEKATILHMLAHQDPARPLGARQSRHYFDVYRLAGSEIGSRALADRALLSSVAEHKRVFFPAAWAMYENAAPGTLRLIPPRERLGELRDDYEQMGEMIFAEPPGFETVIEALRVLESKINAVEAPS